MLLTFHRVGILGLYLRAGFTAQQLAPLRQLSAWPFALGAVAAIAHVLYLRQYFAGGLADGRAGPAADTRGWLPAGARPVLRSARKLLATRKARILAGTVVGALLLCGAIGRAVIGRLLRDKRLAD